MKKTNKNIAITTHSCIDDGMAIHLKSIQIALEKFYHVTCLDDAKHYSISYLDQFDYVIRYGWRMEEGAGFSTGRFDWNISSSSAKNILAVCFDCRMLSPEKIQEIELNFDTLIFDSSFSHQNGIKYFGHKVTEIVSPALLGHPGVKENIVNKKTTSYKFLHISNSLHYIKGVDLIIDAFRCAFDSSNEGVQLEILASENDGKLGEFKAIFQSENRKFQLVINQTRYSHNNIWSLYEKANCYVCASRSETFSLPTVEAASVGLPIIMHNNGGMRDYSPMCVHYAPKSQLETIPENIWRKNKSIITMRPNIRSLASKMMQAYTEKRVNVYESRKALVYRYSTNIIAETLKTILVWNILF